MIRISDKIEYQTGCSRSVGIPLISADASMKIPIKSECHSLAPGANRAARNAANPTAIRSREMPALRDVKVYWPYGTEAKCVHSNMSSPMRPYSPTSAHKPAIIAATLRTILHIVNLLEVRLTMRVEPRPALGRRLQAEVRRPLGMTHRESLHTGNSRANTESGPHRR
jgi:hypothetical protein